MFRLPRTSLVCRFAASVALAFMTLYAGAQASINLRAMPLGDSITAGYDSSTGNGYRQDLATELASQIGYLDYVGSQYDGPMSDPDNEGHFGARIDQIAAITNASLSSYKPNIVLLLAGINDLGQNYQVSTAPNRLASLIDQINSAEPEATVLVATLIVNGDPTIESEVQTFNAALPNIVNTRASAGKHVYLVDMSALKYPADMDGTLHPNDSGYQKMANAWDSAIETVIGKGWITDPLQGTITRPTGTVYSGISGKCLDGGSLTKGGAAVISSCSGGASQQLNFNAGNVIINNLCLDVVGAGTANKTLVDLYSCNGQANQVWTVQSSGRLLNPVSGRCLDDPGGNTTNGTQLEIYDCNTGSNQQWLAPTQGPITSGVSGKCLDDFGGSSSNKTIADSYTCNGNTSQEWEIYNHQVKFDGRCLNVVGGGTANQTKVDVETCTGAANQEWTPVNGTLVNGGSGRCLNIPGANTMDGTQLDIYDCTGETAQKWTLPNS